MSQTLGLYAGPGVYPGPGMYHNMSRLCYFIQKKSSTFMFTGYQYFVYFHTKTSHIEKVQKRATKFIISLKKYSYKDRLIQLNLPTLKVQKIAMRNDSSL